METVYREIGLILSAGIFWVSWLMLPEGTWRTTAIAGSTAAFIVILLGSRAFQLWILPKTGGHINLADEENDYLRGDEGDGTGERDDGEMRRRPTNPRRSLKECIRFYRINNHPATISLLNRIDEFRRIVLLVAREREGNGTLWKQPDSDVRTHACLCGTLTRDELLKSLGIEEIPQDPPRVGAGMGIEVVLANESRTRGRIIAEDGKPANRVLRDPVADNLFQILTAHRPEAKEDLMLARTRYIENVLRRLVGPLDDRGQPIVPLCKWQKRFDGKHFGAFEEIENLFKGI